ncbi:MAG TPA: PSD1 and planctomycete cytochrome C domain-containing protein [Isosphaeraceae bacterium]|nr:PSD1 and planctomycete cytochrome C domain-containing protein [Isosphaeraceae bacterium]
MPKPTPRRRLGRTVGLLLPLLIGPMLGIAPAWAADPADPDGVRLYREKIAPVLKAECYRCHSAEAEKLRGGLRLDVRERLLEGGDSGPAVVPGKSGESLLIHAIRHEDGLAMPPKKPRLPGQTIADFERWINAGAPFAVAGESSPTDSSPMQQARTHWAFQPVKKLAPPPVHDAAWVRNPIDAFILARLEQRRWQPAPPAGRGEWLRRVSFDVTGLPPSPEEIEAFLNDPSPEAEARVVDRLLGSPHYGQRWGQHWLDVVRFAETEGFEYDRHIPDAWRYRDYVISSFNRDKPFDRFVAEQIAGDEIGPGDPECQTASIFHRLGPVRRNAGDADIVLSRNEVLTERTDIIGTAFLGLTIGCARCHNHKLEPIPQKDYYRLQAYLAATEEHNLPFGPGGDYRAWEENSTKIRRAIQKLQRQAQRAMGKERERLNQAIESLEDQIPPPPATIPATTNDFAHRTPIHVLKRGVWENKGEPVGPRPLSVLVSDDLPELAADITDPRTRLARWLAAPDNPLTARVIVNRLWHHHFGMGLVKTVNDFGTKADRPSHPRLLDWLAATLVENGWRLKPIHRLILLSSTYRQSSRVGRGSPDPAHREALRDDPENRLFWRFARRRLEAEEIRDAMLAVSGRLNARLGGPSVMVPVDPEIVQLLYKPSQWQVARDATAHDRRSIYLIAKRNLRLPFLETFDAPALLTSCPRRESSTHAPQALELLNGRLSNDLAAAFARRLEAETGGEPERVVPRAYLLALGRLPTPAERALALEFLREQPLREFTLALFNLNGFLYVP